MYVSILYIYNLYFICTYVYFIYTTYTLYVRTYTLYMELTLYIRNVIIMSQTAPHNDQTVAIKLHMLRLDILLSNLQILNRSLPCF